MNDAFHSAINTPPGRLAEVLLTKLSKEKRGKRQVSAEMHARLEKLIAAPGKAGRLARVRLAADLPFLYARTPRWTKNHIVPLFDWSCPDAADMWAARKYSNAIGSPKLFALIKKPFLELFGQPGLDAGDIHHFAEWLAALVIANVKSNAGYPLSSMEARAALRRAGAGVLSAVGHQLAVEMGHAANDKKIEQWRAVVGPVFQSIWPLDAELQTSSSTFKLVQILIAAGPAFSEAADVIIPFIRSDDVREQTNVFSISQAPEALYEASPSKMLDLLAAMVGDAQPASVLSLDKALTKLRKFDPKLADTRKFQKLVVAASRY
jgi:hypothetical protein